MARRANIVMKQKRKTIFLFVCLLCCLIFPGCPFSTNFFAVSFDATPRDGNADLRVNFEGNVVSGLPYVLFPSIANLFSKLLGPGPDNPCPGPDCAGPAPFVPVTVVEWFWDFGECCGTSTAYGQDVSYIYTEPGCYTVTLVVTLSNGELITHQEDCFISVH
jgi:hypothetical protein